MSRTTLKEVIYTCTNAKRQCGHTQKITFFADDHILPVTCCVKCRAGFGDSLEVMIGQQIGMFPSKPVYLSANPV
jgi:hypothetical protein